MLMHAKSLFCSAARDDGAFVGIPCFLVQVRERFGDSEQVRVHEKGGENAMCFSRLNGSLQSHVGPLVVEGVGSKDGGTWREDSALVDKSWNGASFFFSSQFVGLCSSLFMWE